MATFTSLEINPTINEAKRAYANVSKWAKPESPAFTVNTFPFKPKIRKEAKGTVLIISPFNYPLWLSLVPLVCIPQLSIPCHYQLIFSSVQAGAIAAGNTVVLKPSEISTAMSALITELVPQYIDQDVVRVVNGAVPETTKVSILFCIH